MKQLSIIVTDASPLITLAASEALDTLLLPGLPVIIPDMVRFEVVRELHRPGALDVAAWIRKNEPHKVRVASTEVFEEYQVLTQVNPATKSKDRGEQAAAEVLGNELSSGEFGAILVFEDSLVRKQNFLLRLPDNVVVTSTSEFLAGLEAKGHIPSADAILQQAVSLRGAEILNRHLQTTEADQAQAPSWPDRMRAF